MTKETKEAILKWRDEILEKEIARLTSKIKELKEKLYTGKKELELLPESPTKEDSILINKLEEKYMYRSGPIYHTDYIIYSNDKEVLLKLDREWEEPLFNFMKWLLIIDSSKLKFLGKLSNGRLVITYG